MLFEELTYGNENSDSIMGFSSSSKIVTSCSPEKQDIIYNLQQSKVVNKITQDLVIEEKTMWKIVFKPVKRLGFSSIHEKNVS